MQKLGQSLVEVIRFHDLVSLEQEEEEKKMMMM